MKVALIILFASSGILFFTSCTKNDCVCTTTYTENGVVQSTSTSSGNSIISSPGPIGNSEECNAGDYYYSSTYGGVTTVDQTECELE